MSQLLETIFQLRQHATTWQREVIAGSVSFFTSVYILAVNAAIMQDADLPFAAALCSTIITAGVSCLLVGTWANLPFILVPGMGINAMFAYTLVGSLGLSWQSALGAAAVAGLLFTLIAVSGLAHLLAAAIPPSLKQAISVGIGFFLAFIGLQKGGLVTVSAKTMVSLGDFHDPAVLTTLLTLLLLLLLFVRRVPGALLWSLLCGAGLAWLTGTLASPDLTVVAVNTAAFGAAAFTAWNTPAFWLGVFALTLVIVFENIGLIHGHLQLLNHPSAAPRALQANALSVLLAAGLGTSPTVSTIETAAGITAGGRTGLTACIAGLLFLSALLAMPLIQLVPSCALAPILILIGGLMMSGLQAINLQDFSEAFPAFLIITLIPLTYSIVDGIAFGFITYPLLKWLTGRRHEVSPRFYGIVLLFMVHFACKYIGN